MKKLCIVLLLVAPTASTALEQDGNCSFVPFLPEPWRTAVQTGFNIAFLDACGRHDACYAQCPGSNGQKRLCDLDFLAEMEAWCAAMFGVVDHLGNYNEWWAACAGTVAGVFVAFELSPGETAYARTQCLFCGSCDVEAVCRRSHEWEVEDCEASGGGWDWCECECGANYSPIVLSLEDNRFDFTSLADGVAFDHTGNGTAVLTSWTAAGSDEAFLALDRNGNGKVDDGTELFGNYTEQPRSPHKNGFLALALFDRAVNGGDGDRMITAGDSVFHQLELWTDRNHDGSSQPTEMMPLSGSGIASIDLEYEETELSDRHGNLLRYRAKVRLEDGGLEFAYDVFFLARAIEETQLRPTHEPRPPVVARP